MKHLLAFQSGLACRAGALGCVLLAVTSGAALAQTTGAVNPKPAQVEPSVTEEPPPGGCMPIGLTASGEIVFPFQCKAFIERQKTADQKPAAAENMKPPAAEQKPDAAEDKTDAKQPAGTEKPAIAESIPAAAEEKPATAEKKPDAAEVKAAAAEDKTAAKQSDSVVPQSSKPATELLGPVPLPRRAERIVGPPGCTRFRTYDAASGSYRTFDGQRRECRAVIGQSARK
jgi:hypothetical protein